MNTIKTINYVSLKYTTHMTIYAPHLPPDHPKTCACCFDCPFALTTCVPVRSYLV